jgi:5-methylcytosine-specific restriction endonuclease McrA
MSTPRGHAWDIVTKLTHDRRRRRPALFERRGGGGRRQAADAGEVFLPREEYKYCLLSEAVAGFLHEADHIVAAQHGGQSVSSNLAWACWRCNRHKGPNLGSLDPETGKLVPLYHPRQQAWSDHFRLDGPLVQPLTPEGRVTVKLLRLNDSARVEERKRLIAVGLYPPLRS